MVSEDHYYVACLPENTDDTSGEGCTLNDLPARFVGSGLDTINISNLFDSISEVFFTVDKQLCFTYVNKEAEKLFNSTIDSLVGRHLKEYYSGTGLKFFRYYPRSLRDRKPSRHEDYSWLLNKWFEVLIYPFEGGLSVYLRDITLRKHNDEMLKLTEYSINNVVDSVFWIKQDGSFYYVNNSSLFNLRYSRREMLSMSISDIDTGISPDKWGSIWEEAARNGSLTLESTHRARGGRLFSVEVTFSYVRYNNFEYVFSIARDITYRKAAESEIHEAKRLAELYLDLMGHDINNMNQIGIGYLELALDILELSDDDRQLLIKPLEALENSTKLISNVRKFQRTHEAGAQYYPVNIKQCIDEIITQYSSVANKEIRITYITNCECWVRANDLLVDVFSNLFSNSIKHSQDRTVDINIITNRIKEDGRYHCRVIIEDNGPGIADPKKSLIFERFKRGDTKAKGSGLGLYLVRTLVEYYGGRIRVEDRVAGDHTQGCRFVVVIPSMDRRAVAAYDESLSH